MTKAEIENIMRSNTTSAEMAGYAQSIEVNDRGNGKECWELLFPLWSGEKQKVWFMPSGDIKENTARLIDLNNQYAVDYYAEALKGK